MLGLGLGLGLGFSVKVKMFIGVKYNTWEDSLLVLVKISS